MFGLFKKKAAAAATEMKKVENRDLMEAIIGGCLLVAAADGEIDADEISNLEKQISSNPSLKHFGGEIGQVMNTFTQMLDAGFLIGKMKILREIEDIKNDSAHAEEVFVNMVVIAGADGEVDEKEIAILKEVAQKLGVRYQDYGIE